MPNKANAGLPPPPNVQPSALQNMLMGIKSYFGMGDQAEVQPWDQWLRPVAQSRITQTPIYQADVDYKRWPESQQGEYHPEFDRIEVRPSFLQSDPNAVIPHESAHAIYQKAGLSPASVLPNKVPFKAQMSAILASHPQTATPEQKANEGLAYSIGMPDATPFIEHVASQIQDPKLAAQLRRLHYNALATRAAAASQPSVTK